MLAVIRVSDYVFNTNSLVMLIRELVFTNRVASRIIFNGGRRGGRGEGEGGIQCVVHQRSSMNCTPADSSTDTKLFVTVVIGSNFLHFFS